jgi:hypothetical protein
MSSRSAYREVGRRRGTRRPPSPSKGHQRRFLTRRPPRSRRSRSRGWAPASGRSSSRSWVASKPVASLKETDRRNNLKTATNALKDPATMSGELKDILDSKLVKTGSSLDSAPPLESPRSKIPGLLLEAPSSAAEAVTLRRSRDHATWYGWQTLTADAGAVALLLVGAASFTLRPRTLAGAPNTRPLAFESAGLGIYALAPPIVHFVRGRFWSGLASIGARIALPLAGFGAGLLFQRAGGRSAASLEDAQLGAVFGCAAATATDAGFIA